MLQLLVVTLSAKSPGPGRRFAVGVVMRSLTVADISRPTSGFDSHTATSGCPSMKHLLVYTFLEFGVVENCFFAAVELQ